MIRIKCQQGGRSRPSPRWPRARRVAERASCSLSTRLETLAAATSVAAEGPPAGPAHWAFRRKGAAAKGPTGRRAGFQGPGGEAQRGERTRQEEPPKVQAKVRNLWSALAKPVLRGNNNLHLRSS